MKEVCAISGMKPTWRWPGFYSCPTCLRCGLLRAAPRPVVK